MSPIRPENRDRYPADWKTISLRIRTERAAGRCECLGECGRGTHVGRCPNRNGGQAYGTGGGYLRFLIDGEKRRTVGHPCYRIVYPAVPEPARPRGWCKHCVKDRAMTRDGLMGNHRWGGKGWSEPCPGSGKPPWKPVRNQTHPGEQRTETTP